jgi:radical SAM protein
MIGFDFEKRPFVVIWEVTRACSLVCRHCRASAKVHRHPLELTTEEASRFIDQVVRAAPPLFILTGGDPVRRPDLETIVEYAAQRGLRVGLSPSATPEFVRKDLRDLKRRGVARISLSLDGATRETHDRFRGVPGTWDWTMQAIANAAAAELPIQINTTFTRQNLSEFDGFVERLAEIKPVLWSVFQLVPTGRGKTQDLLTGEEMEWLFHQLYELSKTAPYDIKTTEGHHYRRVVLQQEKLNGGSGPPASGSSDARPPLQAGVVPGPLSGFGLRTRAPLGINDGKGFVFVSHVGEICPSGFLPLVAGNVRTSELLDVYQHSPIFRQLRDTSLLKGKCGRCEYKNICGGSRARAFALTGDYLAEEPLCVYQPRLHPQSQPQSQCQPELVATA